MGCRVLLAICLCAAGTVRAQEPADRVSQIPKLPATEVRVGKTGAGVEDRPLDERWFVGPASVLRSRRSVFDDPRHATIIDRSLLDERAPVDMVQALEREVGILMQRTGRGQASPFIRGLTGPQTVLLVDGIRMNNGTLRMGPNQYFNTIDPGQVDRIEVVRGPQSVMWGSDAIGGAINVVTRRADRALDGSLSGVGALLTQYFSTADLASYTRGNLETSIGGGGLFLGASYLNVNNLDRGGDLGRQPMTHYSQYAGDIRWDRPIGDNQLLTVAVVHFEQMDVPRTDKFPAERRLFDPQQRDLAYVRWQGTESPGLFDAFMMTASVQRMKEGTLRRKPPDSPIEDRKEFDVITSGLSLVLVRCVDGWGRVTWGFDWHHDDVDATAERFDLVSGGMTPLTPQFPDDSWYERSGTWLEWEVPLTARLRGLSGVRYSSIETGATVALFDPNDPGFPNSPPVDTPISPHFRDWTASGGVVYEIDEQVHFVASISEGFRAPLLDELTSVTDNVNEGVDIPTTDLGPERSLNYEVGLKWDGEWFRGQAFYYWTRIDGLVDRVLVGTDIGDPGDPDDDVDFFQRRNVTEVRIDGFELGAEYLLEDGWAVHGNLWYTLGTNATDGEPVSRIPPTQGVIGLRWRDVAHRNWFAIYGWLVARQDRLSARDLRDSRIPDGGTPGYATINIRLGHSFDAGQRVLLNLENLTDREYRVHGSGVDGAGVSATLGYERRW